MKTLDQQTRPVIEPLATVQRGTGVGDLITNTWQPRRTAALELIAAGDQLRVAVRAGIVSRAHKERYDTALQVWDALTSAETGDVTALIRLNLFDLSTALRPVPVAA